AGGPDVDVRAVDGGGLVQRGHARGGIAVGDHVVGEDGHELLAVLRLQQVVHRARGQGGEGGVGGCEDGERARALERVDQARGLEGGSEGLELARGDGGLDDVAAGARRGGLAGHGRRGGDGHGGRERQGKRGGQRAQRAAWGSDGTVHCSAPVVVCGLAVSTGRR